MNYRKKIFIGIVLFVFVLGSIFSIYVYRAIFSPNTSFKAASVAVYIPTYANMETLSAALAPYLKNSNTFFKVASQKGYLKAVKAGKFVLFKGMSNNEIVNTLRAKPSTVKVSFNNQETLNNLAGRVAAQIEADSTELIKAFLDNGFLKENGFNSDNAFGMYLPNTYDFFWNTTAVGFRDRMLKEYQRFWNAERKALAAKQRLSPMQVISLAAVVHKESVKPDERPRVAGVYLNRIKRGMKLQADPTVIFAMKKKANNFNLAVKRVLYEDLVIDSPFNTYLNRGIPPGPIFMPDLSAIMAVLKPEKHSYLYFVADTSNFGYHIFSKNLYEHNQNKKQYVAWLNKNNISR